MHHSFNDLKGARRAEEEGEEEEEEEEEKKEMTKLDFHRFQVRHFSDNFLATVKWGNAREQI